MFDTVCKFLVETFSADFAAWLLGALITLTELSPAELSLEPIRADALIPRHHPAPGVSSSPRHHHGLADD